MLYHERERRNKENANFVYIVYLLTKLCNIFDEAFFIDVSIVSQPALILTTVANLQLFVNNTFQDNRYGFVCQINSQRSPHFDCLLF